MSDGKAISSATKLRLFSDSSGHCQNPECLDALFPPEMGGEKHIAEMAHIIPNGRTGPRYEDRPGKNFDVNSYDNIILLCPTCHTKIDKDPEAYPRNTLLDWKASHFAQLVRKQGIKTYDNRSQVRTAIVEILSENKAIWDQFSPEHGSEFDYNPESEVATAWDHRVKSVILPNHFRALAIIEKNLELAIEDEHRIFAEYKEHVRGLSERHVCGVAGRATRFPSSMEDMFI